MAHEPRKVSLIDPFSALEDPRQAWRVVYPLPEILRLGLGATPAGADDCGGIAASGAGSTSPSCAGSCPTPTASPAMTR